MKKCHKSNQLHHLENKTEFRYMKYVAKRSESPHVSWVFTIVLVNLTLILYEQMKSSTQGPKTLEKSYCDRMVQMP